MPTRRVSTRQVDDVAASIGICGMSKSQVRRPANTTLNIRSDSVRQEDRVADRLDPYGVAIVVGITTLVLGGVGLLIHWGAPAGNWGSVTGGMLVAAVGFWERRRRRDNHDARHQRDE